MRYWITTHWPRRIDEPDTQSHGGVWVPDGKKHVIDPIAPGDLVFIYEAKSGRTELRTYVDGSVRKVRCKAGQGGVVALVRVTENAYELEDSQPEKYTDRTQIWWRYYASTESVHSGGLILRGQAASLLGYSENYSFKGFGEAHTGLRQLPADLFERLRTAFIQSAERDELDRIGRAGHSRYGPGGEGPQHLALKQRIAADPAGTLGEPGLRLFALEWVFPTADRIDVLLKDEFDRFVAVKVEVDCDGSELIGPLQCMKYRAMLSYYFSRPIEEFRTILAAHSIHGDVRRQCGQYGIHCVAVPDTAGLTPRNAAGGCGRPGWHTRDALKGRQWPVNRRPRPHAAV